MNNKFKKWVKIFLVVIEIALLYMISCNIFNFINLDKNIKTITNFICESMYILTIFSINIITLVLFKSENIKRLNTGVMLSAVLSVLLFMDNLVLYNYIEVFIFYFISVVFLLFSIFNFNLVGEKHSTFKFETRNINKYIVIAVILVVMVLECVSFFNLKSNMNGIINGQELKKVGMDKLILKEFMKLVIKEIIFTISILVILIDKIKNKPIAKILLYALLLLISVFNVKYTNVYFIYQILISVCFVNYYLDYKKKIEI